MARFADKFPHVKLATALGDDIVYKRGAKKYPMKADVNRNVQGIGGEGTVLEYNTEVEILAIALPFLPARGDVITDDKGSFTVDGIISNDGDWIKLAVH